MHYKHIQVVANGSRDNTDDRCWIKRARRMNGIYTVLADPSVLPEGMANDKKKGYWSALTERIEKNFC